MRKLKIEKKRVIALLVIFCICLFSEIFLFNMRSFRLVGKDYQSKTVSMEDCNLVGLEKMEGNQYRVTSQMAIIEIKDINQELRYNVFGY